MSRTTIMRGVLRHVPEYERRWSRFARSPGSSRRMNETAITVRGMRHDLYRAVDRHGKSVASLLCCTRSMQAAQTFFRAAVSQDGVPWPTRINVDGNSATRRGLRLLRDEDHRLQGVEVRARRHLNNVVGQDHRPIRQRCAPMLGHYEFRSAAIMLAAIELAHRIREQQYLLPTGLNRRAISPKDCWAAVLATSDVSGCCRSDRDSPMHQHSAAGPQWPRKRRRIDGQVQYPRQISSGGSLYLLIRPEGGRYWHYHCRYGGKRKTLSLVAYPDVPTALAQARHSVVRRLLAAGIDPSLRKRELRPSRGGSREDYGSCPQNLHQQHAMCPAW